MRLLVMKSNIDIYLLTLPAGRQSRENLDFPALLYQIKRPSASQHFCLFRRGNNASGDNNIVITIQSTSTHVIIWFAPPRDPACGGYYEYYSVQKRELMQKVKCYAPGNQTENDKAASSVVKFTGSLSFHVNPLDIFLKCNCFPFGSTLFFTNNNQRSERYTFIKDQKLLKLLSRADIRNWVMSWTHTW